jgi:hypothetical protein
MHAGRDGAEARRYFADAIERAELTDAKNLLAAACADLSAEHEREGDLAAALAAHKRYHAVREAEFATTRQHARARGHPLGSTSSTPRSRRRSTASRQRCSPRTR